MPQPGQHPVPTRFFTPRSAWQEEFETEVGGLLQRSSAQQDQHYRELVSQSCCTFCRKVSVGLKQCSACKTAQYCSRECQVRHWRAGHRQECGASAR